MSKRRKLPRARRKGEALKVTARACASCPYLRSHPSGVWSAEEYEKLRLYDTGHKIPAEAMPRELRRVPVSFPEIATFWCHQTNASRKPTACRGWLSTHRDHAAVNLGISLGAIRVEDIPTEDESDTYFATGTEACENGLRDIDDPGPAAIKMAERLTSKGAGQWEEEDA